MKETTQKLSNAQKASEQVKQQLNESQKENSEIVAQLHKTQEELENYYQKNQDTVNKLNESQKQIANLENDKQNAKQALEKSQKQIEKHKQELPKLEQENQVLLKQLHIVQEELERYYNQAHNIQSEKTSLLYGAAERVKQDLPYRLGATMIQQSKSLKGLLSLPFTLKKIYREFQPIENLPDIASYQDAFEAEKVKRHLSYRLGRIWIKNIGNPIRVIYLPIALTKEVCGFKKNNKKRSLK